MRSPCFILSLVALAACAALDADPAEEDGGGKADGDRAGRYLPVAEWSGRLILPDPDERRPGDGVWIAVENAPAPHQNLIGHKLWLGWRNTPSNADRLARTVIDIRFDQRARDSQAQGNVHPTRLDGWRQVGPLESLAGARPVDDVRVELRAPEVVGSGSQASLLVADEPRLLEGRRTALVTVVREVSHDDRSARLRVRHYDPEAGAFTGPEVDMVFPRAAAKDAQHAPMTSVDELAGSPLNADGWYVSGEFGDDGRFHAESLEPRALFRIEPDRVAGGRATALDYLATENWKDTPRRKGTAQRVFADATASPGSGAPAWHEGDRFVVIHLFGAVSGQPGETAGPVRPGHFSFGTATIARDRFTDEQRFVVDYRQVYAHNGAAVLAGSHSWASYMGSLRRGWMYLRPISDVLLRFDPVTVPYDFGGLPFDALAGFVHELEIMTARYRSGNGTGAALVTPATSCVQDSAHALFVALAKFEERAADPRIASWLASHPADAERFGRLRSLIDWLGSYLSPFGIERSDWRASLGSTAITDGCPGSTPGQLACGLLSYNTMFPRHAHDRLIGELLDRGAAAWFLRTNQIAGVIRGFDPLAPTSPTIP